MTAPLYRFGSLRSDRHTLCNYFPSVVVAHRIDSYALISLLQSWPALCKLNSIFFMGSLCS
jgi:hypothetical protein